MSERSLFIRALEIDDPTQRAELLSRECGDDAELRHRIEKLLSAHTAAGGILDKPPVNPPATDLFRPITEGPGTVIGPYKLLQQIGEGGFGVVYMAEQQRPVRRKVALKIIKPGMDTREVIARFESERQALALMDHPNIARVLDGGTTDSGRPFFVMELVKGVPLTQFCDDNKLDTRERLKLFSTVCKAIQHAHHKGVIHRDIKPSNVMVTLHDGQPVPKVIDFGVSKAISQQLTEKTMFTAYGQMIGTPAYMSPEQAEMSGLDIDTRSDVYSLGVLLYELLTGSTPLGSESLRGKAYAELQRMIREDEPLRPSLRVSTLGEATALIAAQRGTVPRELGALLRGELDWIVMKALEKNRDRRYESANTFAADVERYLKHEAIEACPPSTLYRLRKFIRRNRVACTTGGLIATTLLICTLISAIAARNALFNRRLAEESLRVALADRQQAEQAQKNTVAALQTAQRERDRAEKAKAEESKQREQAEQQRLAAEAAEKSAATERTAAVQERDKATAASAELAKQKEQQRRLLYVAQMNLIQTAWNDNNLSRVQDLLNATRPRPGETDLRSIEWHYWQRMLHQEERGFRLPIGLPTAARGFNGPPGSESPAQGTATSAFLSHDGSRLATILTSRTASQPDYVLQVWNTESGSTTPIFTHKLPRPTTSPSGRGTIEGGPGSSGSTSARRIVHLGSSRIVLSQATRTRTNQDELRDLFERSRNASPEEQEAIRDEFSQRLQGSSENEVVSLALDAAPDSAARASTAFTIRSSFVFSRDGSRIATLASTTTEGNASAETNIVILDAKTGATLDQFPCPLRRATLGAISDDGQRLLIFEPRSRAELTRERGAPVFGSRPPLRQLMIVNTATRETITLQPQSPTSGLLNTTIAWLTSAFTPNAERLVLSGGQSASSPPTLFFFDAATGQELPNSNSGLSSSDSRRSSSAILAISPDGKWLASNSGDPDQNLLGLWDLATGKPGPQIKGHATTPVLAAFNSNSSRLITADVSGSVKVWPVVQPTIAQAPTSDEVRGFATSRTQSWNVQSLDGRWKATAPRSEAQTRAPFNTPSATAQPPLELKLEDTTGKTASRTVPLSGPANALVFSPDSRYVAALTISPTAKLSEAVELLVWNVATLERLSLPSSQFQASEISRPSFGPPERGTPSVPTVPTVPTASNRVRNFGGQPPVFSPDSRRLAIGGTPSNTTGDFEFNHLWDLEQQKKLDITLPKPPPGGSISIHTQIFSPDSKLLLLFYPRTFSAPSGLLSSTISRSRLEGIHILDAVTGSYLWGDGSDLALTTFSADSRRLAAIWAPAAGSGSQPAIIIWNAATGEQLSKIELPLNRQFTSLALSPRGDRVAVQAAGAATIYDVASQKMLYTIDGLRRRLVFTADGNRLVTSAQNDLLPFETSLGGPFLRRDNTPSAAKIWDCVTGQQLLTVSTESPLFPVFQSGQGMVGFPPLSPAVEAESIVDWLLAADTDGNYLTRREIAERLQNDPSPSIAARAIALKLAASRKRSVSALANAALAILHTTGLTSEQYQRALEWLEEVIEQSPNDPILLSRQGVAFYRLGDYTSAQSTLERSIKLRADARQPSLPDTCAFLSMTHHQLGRADDARRLFIQAQRELEIINRLNSRGGGPGAGFGRWAGSGGDLPFSPSSASASANNLDSLYEASALLGLPLISHLIDEAIALRNQQKYDEALAKIDQALGLDNEHATLYVERANIWRLKSEFDKAIADCDAAIRLNPKDPEAFNLRGLSRMAKPDAAKALTDYNTAIGLNALNSTYLTNRGNAHRQLGNIPAALADYNQALRLSRVFAPAWLYRNRADLWYLDQEMDLAIQDATTWIRLDPRPVGYGNRGIFRLRLGDYDGAIRDVEEALSREPGAPIFLTNLAAAKIFKGELDAALENLDQAVRGAPQLAPARFWRGYLYEKQGLADKATAEYDAFLKLSGAPTAGLLDRANRWGYWKEFDKAITDYTALLALEPTHHVALCSRGRAWAAKGNYENALLDFEAAIKAAPNRADGYQALAWLRATCPDEKFRDPEAALTAATKANEVSGGKYWKHLDTLAAAYAANGDFAQAIKHEQYAVSLLTGFSKPDYQSRLALYRENKPYREPPILTPAP